MGGYRGLYSVMGGYRGLWVVICGYSIMGGVYVIWEIDNTDLCGFKE